MMDSTRSRLGRLLSRERARHYETADAKLINKDGSDEERFPNPAEVDASPVTSPDNLYKTRKRLSRLLQSREDSRFDNDTSYTSTTRHPFTDADRKAMGRVTAPTPVEPPMIKMPELPDSLAVSRSMDKLSATSAHYQRRRKEEDEARDAAATIAELNTPQRGRRRVTIQARETLRARSSESASVTPRRTSRGIKYSTSLLQHGEQRPRPIPPKARSLSPVLSRSGFQLASRYKVEEGQIDQHRPRSMKDEFYNDFSGLRPPSMTPSKSVGNHGIDRDVTERTLRRFDPNEPNSQSSLFNNALRTYDVKDSAKYDKSLEPPTSLKLPTLEQRNSSSNTSNDDDSIFEIDLNIFQEIDYKLHSKLRNIIAVRDWISLHRSVSTLPAFINRLGVCESQLWMISDTAERLLFTQRSDGREFMLDLDQTHLLMNISASDFSGAKVGSSETNVLVEKSTTVTNLLTPPNVTTIYPDHMEFEALASIVRCGGIDNTDWSGRSDGRNAWVAIHIIQLQRRKFCGVMITVEIAAPSLPFSTFIGLRERNLVKLRRYMLLQLLQKVGTVIESKFIDFESHELAAAHAQEISHLEGKFAEQDANHSEQELLLQQQADNVKQRQMELHFKDAMLACSGLLSEAEHLEHPLMIASAIAKSGCVKIGTVVHDGPKSTKCWLIFRPIRHFQNPGTERLMDNLEIQSVQQQNESSVIVLSGHIDGKNPLSLQQKPLTRLIHEFFSYERIVNSGDESVSECFNRVISSSSLVENGLPLNSDPSQTNFGSNNVDSTGYNIYGIPLIINSFTSIFKDTKYFNNTTHQAALVLATPQSVNAEIAKSHLNNLLSCAEQAFHSHFIRQKEQIEGKIRKISSVLHGKGQLSLTDKKIYHTEITNNPRLHSFEDHNILPVANSLSKLQDILSLIDSEVVANMFSVNKATLVVSDHYLSSLGLMEKDSYSHYNFFRWEGGDVEDIISVPCGALNPTEALWIQDLLNGKLVYFDSFTIGENNHSSSGADVSSVLLRGEESSQSVILPSELGYSQQKLRSFVLSIDPFAKYSLLIPIRTKFGFSVLLLNDFVSRRTQSISSSDGGNTKQAFVSAYAECLIASGICADFISVLTHICCLHKNEYSHIQTIERLISADVRVNNLAKLAMKLRRKIGLGASFMQWKNCILNKLADSGAHALNATLETMRELIKFRFHAPNIFGNIHTENTPRFPITLDDCIDDYCTCLNKQLTKHFPLDTISVLRMGTDDNSVEMPKVEPGEVYKESYSDRECVYYELIDSFEGTNLEAFEKQLDVVTAANRSFTPNTGSELFNTGHNTTQDSKSDVDYQKKKSVVALVKISRSTKVARSLSEHELATFRNTIDMASELLSAIHRGMKADFASGDVEHLALPMLKYVLPSLISQPSICLDPRNKTCILPYLVQWLKRVCDADIVLLHLIPSSTNGIAERHVQEADSESIGEILLSSEVLEGSAQKLIPADDQSNVDNFPKLDDNAKIFIERSFPSVAADDNMDKNNATYGKRSDCKESIVLKLYAPDPSGSESHFERNSSKQLIGELKVLGAKSSSFREEHCLLIQIIGYVITNSLCSTYRESAVGKLDAHLHDELDKLRQKFNDAEQRVVWANSVAENVRERVVNIARILDFAAKAAEVNSLPTLSALICEALPGMISCSSAVLVANYDDRSVFAPISHSNNDQVEPEFSLSDSFSVVLPRSSKPSEQLLSSTYAALSNSRITLQQLVQIPSIFDHDANTVADKLKMDLHAPDGRLFGAVLFFRSSSVTNVSDVSSGNDHWWHGFEESISRCVSHVIYEGVKRIFLTDELLSKTSALNDADVRILELSKLEIELQEKNEQCENLSSVATTLQEELHKAQDSAHQAISELKEQVRQLEFDHNQLNSKKLEESDEHTRNLNALEKQLHLMRQVTDELKSSREQLLEVGSSYTMDQRCNDNGVMKWLKDVAGGANVKFIAISQASPSSEYRGGEQIRGITAAVGEAVRTGLTIDFISSYIQGNDADTLRSSRRDDGSSVRYYRSGGQMVDDGSNSFSHDHCYSQKHNYETSSHEKKMDNGGIAVLCVPNRCVMKRGHQSAQICFVFVKEVDQPNEQFPVQLKDLLNFAANLSSRALMKSSVQFSRDEFQEIEDKLRRSLINEARLQQVVQVTEDLRKREYQSKNDVRAALVTGVVSLMTRGELDPCVVDCDMILPPWENVSSLSFIGMTNPQSRKLPVGGGFMSTELEGFNRVLSSAKPFRRGPVCWVPLIDRKGEIRGLLRVERKFSERSEVLIRGSAYGETKSSTSNDDLVTSYRLLEASEITGINSQPQISVNDIMFSEADQELLMIFGGLVGIPLLERVEFVGDAFEGVQQAGKAIMALQEAKNTIEDRYASEAARRIQCQDCLRAVVELLRIGTSKKRSKKQIVEVARRSILNITSSNECCIILPSTGNVTSLEHEMGVPLSENISSESKGFERRGDRKSSLHAYLTDDFDPAAVQLENSDVEASVVESDRSIIGVVGNALSADTMLQSWSARHLEQRMLRDGEITGTTSLNATGVNSKMGMFLVAVPLKINEHTSGVVTCLRQTTSYSELDKDCLYYFCKVFMCCLDICDDDAILGNAVARVFDLEDKLNKVHDTEQRYELLLKEKVKQERDENCLLNDLVATATRDLNSIEFQSWVDRLSRANDHDSSITNDDERLDLICMAAETCFKCDRHALSAWSVVDIIPECQSFLHISEGNNKLSTVHFNDQGSITYWEDDGIHSEEEIEFYQRLGLSPNAFTISAKNENTKNSVSKEYDEENIKTLYILVQMSAYPAAVVKIKSNSVVTSKRSLRILIMCQLLRNHVHWFQVISEALSDAQSKEIRHTDEIVNLVREIDEKEAQLQKNEDANKVNLSSTKERYQMMLTRRKASHDRAQKLLIDSLLLTHTIDDHDNVPFTKTRDFLYDVVKRAVHIFSSHSGSSISVAVHEKDSVKGAYDTWDMKRFDDGRHYGCAESSTLFDKDSLLKLEEEHVIDEVKLHWLTEKPPQHEQEKRLSATGKSPSYQASVVVELFDGHAHADPFQIAVATGKTIIFHDDSSSDPQAYSNEILSPRKRELLLKFSAALAENHRTETDNSWLLKQVDDYDSAKSDIIFMRSTTIHPVGTIILPINIASISCTLLIMAKLEIEHEKNGGAISQTEECMTRYAALAMFCSLLALKSTILKVGKRHQQRRIDDRMKKKTGLMQLQSILNNSNYSYPSTAVVLQQLFFQQMKAQTYLKGWHKLADFTKSLHTKCRAFIDKVHRMEGSVADWTEIVKGLNGASIGLRSGVKGVWAQSCRTLLNIISSQVKIKGCGLILRCIEDSAKQPLKYTELREYTVREVTTPIAATNAGFTPSERSYRAGEGELFTTPDAVLISKTADPIELADYASGVLHSHNVSDLGKQVEALVEDIFDGSTSTQPIFKLNASARANYSHEVDESVWLVPVRTARKILGILRVTVEHPKVSVANIQKSVSLDQDDALANVQFPPAVLKDMDDVSPSEIAQQGGSAASADDAISGFEFETANLNEQAERLECAQRNAVNFSEVFAPLLMAAQLMDNNNIERLQLNETAQRSAATIVTMEDELRESSSKTSEYAAVLHDLHSLCSRKWHVEHTDSLRDILQKLCDQITKVLATRFHGRIVIHIFGSELFVLENGDGTPCGEITSSHRIELLNDSRQEHVQFTEHLRDQRNNHFGAIKYSNQIDERTGRARVRIDSGRELSASFSNQGSSSAVSDATITSSSLIAAILRPTAGILSGLLRRVLNEFHLKQKLTRSVAEVKSLETTLEQERKANLLALEEKELISKDIEFYRNLADLINECLQFSSGRPKAATELVGDLMYEESKFQLSKAANLLDLLRGISHRLNESLITCCGVSFALLDSPIEEIVETEPYVFRFENHRQRVTWIHDGIDSSSSKNSGLSWNKLNSQARDVLYNLAQSCAYKKTVSSIDIVVNASNEEMGRDLTSTFSLEDYPHHSIRVISYPLIDKRRNISLGVMQCLMRESDKTRDMEPFLIELCGAISSAASVEVNYQVIDSIIATEKINLVASESQFAAAQSSKAMWQQRCSAWYGLAMVSGSLGQSILASDTITSVIDSDAISAALYDTGLSIRLRQSSNSSMHRGSTSSMIDDYPEHDVFAKTVVPLQDEDESYAEIVCTLPPSHVREKGIIDGAQQNGISAIASDLVNCASTLIRSAVAIKKANESEILQCNHKVASIQDHAHQEINSLTKELGALHDEIARIRQNAEERINEIQITADQRIQQVEEQVESRLLEEERDTQVKIQRIEEAASEKILSAEAEARKKISEAERQLTEIASSAEERVKLSEERAKATAQNAEQRLQRTEVDANDRIVAAQSQARAEVKAAIAESEEKLNAVNRERKKQIEEYELMAQRRLQEVEDNAQRRIDEIDRKASEHIEEVERNADRRVRDAEAAAQKTINEVESAAQRKISNVQSSAQEEVIGIEQQINSLRNQLNDALIQISSSKKSTSQATVDTQTVMKDVHQAGQQTTQSFETQKRFTMDGRYCVPYVLRFAEVSHIMSVELMELSSLLRDEILFTAKEDMMRMLWERVLTTTDHAIASFLRGSFPHHLSVVMKTPDPSIPDIKNEATTKNVLQVKIIDGRGAASQIHTVAAHPEQSFLDLQRKLNNLPRSIAGRKSSRKGKSTRESSERGILPNPIVSVLEQCFRNSAPYSVSGDDVQPADLVGIDQLTLSSLFEFYPLDEPVASDSQAESGEKSQKWTISVICVPVTLLIEGQFSRKKSEALAVLRLVFPCVDNKEKGITDPTMFHNSTSLYDMASTAIPSKPEQLIVKMLPSMLKLVATQVNMLLETALTFMDKERKQDIDLMDVKKQVEEERNRVRHAELLLSRSRKVHRVVCREMSALLDPPLLGPGETSTDEGGISASSSQTRSRTVVHPAALAPLAATQDTCLKVLRVVRTLLRSEGQALLLKDPQTEPVTYQVIYTGGSLHWPGVPQGSFGVVSSGNRTDERGRIIPERTSLADATQQSGKSIQVVDAHEDARYSAFLDGICRAGTSILMIPLRGRGGVVVGVLIAAKNSKKSHNNEMTSASIGAAAGFNAEDIVAGELCSTFASQALYWCQGLGSLHQQIIRSNSKLSQLRKRESKKM